MARRGPTRGQVIPDREGWLQGLGRGKQESARLRVPALVLPDFD